MSNVGSLLGDIAGAVTAAATASQQPSNVSAELAKCERELSDWVHCPSSKTSAGRANIAEITAKLDGLKAQMKRTDDVKAAAMAQEQPKPPAATAAHSLRFDQLGAWLNVQA
jgi:hypothetical protein